jgi:RNA polymerase sigma factor (sigma-70 family)
VSPPDDGVEALLRTLAAPTLAALVRRHHDFDACEDALQEALLAAALQWPADGVPDNPTGWLLTVASRRLSDQLRSDVARHRREERAAAGISGDERLAPAADVHAARDDTLELLFLCCHPALSPPSQVALTLRAVGGLTTAQIARAFLVPETTMAQRVSRAKRSIRAAGLRFGAVPEAERDARLAAVLHVLYLVFNEGYTATSGAGLHRVELTTEATRLTRELHQVLPNDGEVTGLLALMLLTDARRPARTRPDGALVPLAEQDRTLWHRPSIDTGVALVTHALSHGRVGPYQLQAAIAAVHAQAQRVEDTDWAQVVALYELLERVAPNPMVTLNRAVAVGMARGPEAGLALLATLDGDPRLAGHHRLDAVRAHLLDRAGEKAAARAAFAAAARRATSAPERRYLQEQAARLISP